MVIRFFSHFKSFLVILGHSKSLKVILSHSKSFLVCKSRTRLIGVDFVKISIFLKNTWVKTMKFVKLLIQWFQARCRVFSRLGVNFLQKRKKSQPFPANSTLGPKSASAAVVSGLPWLAMTLRDPYTLHLRYILAKMTESRELERTMHWQVKVVINLAFFMLIFFVEKNDFLLKYLRYIIEILNIETT